MKPKRFNQVSLITTGVEIDKFEKLGLTPDKAHKAEAPLIREYHAGFECRLHDTLVEKYNFFIFEVVKAHVPLRRSIPRRSLHRRWSLHGLR